VKEKLKWILVLGGSFLLILIKFAIDVVNKTELTLGGLSMIREIAVIGAFGLGWILVDIAGFRRDPTPLRRLVYLFILSGGVVILTALAGLLGVAGFDGKNLSLVPLDYPTVFVASMLGVIVGLYVVSTFILLRDLALIDRKSGMRRLVIGFSAFAALTGISVVGTRPLDSTTVNIILFVVSVVLAVVISFRLPWIVHLSKRQKLLTLVVTFFLFVMLLQIDLLLGRNSLLNRSILYYSYPMREFALVVSIFATVYVGMTGVSTLFHLPTAEAFDRKRSEISSLHTLSKLVTQSFDYNELIESVTSMALRVVEASRCWVEVMLERPEVPGGQPIMRVVGSKNIELSEIDVLVPPFGESIRTDVLRSRQPVVVDSIAKHPRFGKRPALKELAGSLVAVPLISHERLSGILYATKKEAFGFPKDDLDVMSAFADQVTIALENSRLIRESLERERIYREMIMAREMQQRLLPQAVPSSDAVDIAALSTPAFEVGGDYYDFTEFDDGRIGIIVGDVSGKGVSAAFYMSELKGIFQSLARLYNSPKEFVVRANEALCRSIDKHSFVSLLYAILDTASGEVRMARAGHTPLLHISGGKGSYVRPGGLGMGLSKGEPFHRAIEEESIRLVAGDVCVLYTDGVTEARQQEDEYGYERLLETAERICQGSAREIKREIIRTVNEFAGERGLDDDLTVVVMKWHGNHRRIAAT
jgi:sigma-B regulation protein RsbU (phosphoserine phosphatase)